MKHPQSVDGYIASFPPQIRKTLKRLRHIVRREAPEAEERISYRIPAFYQNGYLVWYAGYSKHIGFYPTSSGIRAFRKKLSKYKCSRGTVQFPLDQPLPDKLIRQIVKFRMKQNSKKKSRESKRQNQPLNRATP
jgi:uncharacterized protein YdhG (YjbR/CyaY superfamily)